MISNNVRLLVVPSASFKANINNGYNIAVACALLDSFTGRKKLTICIKVDVMRKL